MRPVSTVQRALQSLRFVHAAFLISVALCAFTLGRIPVNPSRRPTADPFLSAGVLTLLILGVAFAARLTYVRPALATLRSNPDDAKALLRWRLVAILSALLADCVAVIGVILHVVGGTNVLSGVFLLASAVVLLLWWPRQP